MFTDTNRPEKKYCMAKLSIKHLFISSSKQVIKQDIAVDLIWWDSLRFTPTKAKLGLKNN